MVDLDEHERLEAAAKPAPWTWRGDEVECEREDGKRLVWVSKRDADLIVAMRNDHAALLAELRRWRQA